MAEVKRCLDCGSPKSDKGKYCKKCGYNHRTRKSGLVYKIVSKNKGWFSKGVLQKTAANSGGFLPWNKGTKGICKPNSGSFIKRMTQQEREDSDKYTKKKAWLKHRYNITPEYYDELFILQNNCCVICGELFTVTPDIDHSHRTGKVRGLLCNGCNIMLGGARDNISILEQAIIYLQEREYENE